MNSWNRSTSYARNVKLHNLTLPRSVREKIYEFLDLPEAYDGIHELIAEFERKHDYAWQVGFNGRSSGYLVLYQGGKKASGYKTKCTACGRYTWYETEQPCHVDGCTGSLRPLGEEHSTAFCYPGRGTDDDADFAEWSIEELQDRVKLVRNFDRLCEACVKSFIRFAKTHTVEEKEILVSETVRIAVDNN